MSVLFQHQILFRVWSVNHHILGDFLYSRAVSFFPSPTSIFCPPFLQLHSCTLHPPTPQHTRAHTHRKTPPLAFFLISSLFWHIPPSFCWGSSDDNSDARPTRSVSCTVSWKKHSWSSPSLSPSSARWREPILSSVHPHQAGWQSQSHLLFTPLINYEQAKGALRGRRLQKPLSVCHP